LIGTADTLLLPLGWADPGRGPGHASPRGALVLGRLLPSPHCGSVRAVPIMVVGATKWGMLTRTDASLS